MRRWGVDDADRADLDIARELEAAIAAARGVKTAPRRSCRVCDEQLQVHRQPYGICWACQDRAEAHQRHTRAGA